ncbi:BQ5605_C022g09588 [Microbotryum silenes-dioicae]|uniref:BQ5605_C022g09588 protein n=1 Tax=Microbotryum silenes-dioicae TaxID=796604 RepID=A0A2X0MP96_9BASI|nr:BQ5605_C022g09588 [Microbotryum silenes-dioicae]
MNVIARWPTRWHPSFAPNRSHRQKDAQLSCGLASMHTSLDLCRFTPRITSASPTSFTRVVERPLASLLIESTGLIDDFHRRGKLGVCRKLLLDSANIQSTPIRTIDLWSDPSVDRPNRQTSTARSLPIRTLPITTTRKVTIRSTLAMAASTASTANLPPHSCSVALDSLSPSDLFTMNANPTIDSFSTHLSSSPIDTLHLTSP